MNGLASESLLIPGRDLGIDGYLRGRLPDETAHANDQFFPGTTPGGTALTVSGTATWVQGRGRLGVRFDSQSTTDAAVRLWSLTPSAAPVTIETAVEVMLAESGIPHVGLCFTDGVVGTSNCWTALIFTGSVTASFYVYKGTLNNFGSASTAGANVAVNAMPWGRMHIRSVWTAADTFEPAWSPDGVTWTDFGITADAHTMTPTHFGVLVSTWGGTEKDAVSVNYLRVNETDLSV